MFKARHEANLQALRSLRPEFIEEGNYSAALLCLMFSISGHVEQEFKRERNWRKLNVQSGSGCVLEGLSLCSPRGRYW